MQTPCMYLRGHRRTLKGACVRWMSAVRVERVRQFGEVHLALSLWRRPGLHTLLNELIPPGREEVAWERITCLLTVARFCAQPSELGWPNAGMPAPR